MLISEASDDEAINVADVTISRNGSGIMKVYLLLFVVVSIGFAGIARVWAEQPPEPQASGFSAPVLVVINGYNDDAMEPFISKDGKYLFFNNRNDPAIDTNIHYALRVSDVSFDYIGLLPGINSSALDGVPSMASNGRFHFISTRSYDQSKQTVYWGKLGKNGTINSVELLPGDVARKQAPWYNMDAEISADGKTLYYVENYFDTQNNVPSTSDIGIARLSRGNFTVDVNSDYIMQNINTGELEYAPALSSDELTIYFNRTSNFTAGSPTDMMTRILVAKRSSTAEPFAMPQWISTITGLAEGASVNGAGNRLYFHRFDGTKFGIYMVQSN